MKSQRKLSMLQLAEELGNVSKACKADGLLDARQFYEIKEGVPDRRSGGSLGPTADPRLHAAQGVSKKRRRR